MGNAAPHHRRVRALAIDGCHIHDVARFIEVACQTRIQFRFAVRRDLASQSYFGLLPREFAQ